MQKYEGHIKWYNVTGRYGYIAVDAAAKAEWQIAPERDLFFHVTGLIGRFPKPVPEAGQPCSFNIAAGEKGPRAFNILLRCPERLERRSVTGFDSTEKVSPQAGAPRFPEHVRD